MQEDSKKKQDEFGICTIGKAYIDTFRLTADIYRRLAETAEEIVRKVYDDKAVFVKPELSFPIDLDAVLDYFDVRRNYCNIDRFMHHEENAAAILVYNSGTPSIMIDERADYVDRRHATAVAFADYLLSKDQISALHTVHVPSLVPDRKADFFAETLAFFLLAPLSLIRKELAKFATDREKNAKSIAPPRCLDFYFEQLGDKTQMSRWMLAVGLEKVKMILWEENQERYRKEYEEEKV